MMTVYLKRISLLLTLKQRGELNGCNWECLNQLFKRVVFQKKPSKCKTNQVYCMLYFFAVICAFLNSPVSNA